MFRSTRRALLLVAASWGWAMLGGCGEDARSSAFDDVADADVADQDQVDGASDCADGCRDDSACTADRCADDGVTCLHTFDAALCCTDDQCDIDGVCHDNLEANPDNPCQVCLVVVAADAWSADDTAACDDGSACTLNDACVDGECVGDTLVCDDDDPCTDDWCSPFDGCTTVNNAATCDDGDLCTQQDRCADGVCTPGTPLACDDGNGCTVDTCDPASGCVFAADDAASCDDGDVCSTVDVCQAGGCVAAETDTCDDQDLCTADSCDAVDGCAHRDLSTLCADTNPCTDEGCDPAQGCVYPFNTDACDDGNRCTAADLCTAGACVGVAIDPDDSNPCTDDTCDPDTGVANVPNTLTCDDLDACTVGDVCASGGCQPGTQPLDCDDLSLCTADACDAAIGCVNTDISAACNDDNACTTDSCDAATGCRNVVIQSYACRPVLVVDFPPRAATLTDNGTVLVTVTGSISSGAGPITAFTLNGQDVTVAADGTFAVDFSAQVGANVLSFLAEDALGTQEERVQSFHLSSDYTLPNALTPGNDPVDPGLGLWFAQQTFDDGQAPPPTDFAAIFQGVLDNFDLGGLLPNPVVQNADGGAAGTYDVALTNVAYGATVVTLRAIDGGLHLTAVIPNLTADLTATKTCSWSIWNPLSCVGPGTITGDLVIANITLTADLLITTDPATHTLQVTTANVSAVVATPVVNIDGWLAFIIEPIIQGQLTAFVPTLETQFANQLGTVLGPMLEDAFSALAFNQSFDLPRLDGAVDAGGNPIVITVNLQSDFTYTDFQDDSPGPQGGAFGLRAWATTPLRGVPAGYPFDANLGVPMRTHCGNGTQVMVVPRLAPMEIIFPDDTLNQILRAAWWGGLLEFPIDASMLGSVDLSTYGISDLDMTVSGWLPPVASDCGPSGDLRLYVGDMRIDASMLLFGQPLDLVVYVAFEAPIALAAANGQITITVQTLENVQLETNVVQENMLGSESIIRNLLTTQLVPALGGMLGGGQPLTSFPLPEIDLSTSLNQPVGTTVIRIQTLTNPSWDPRQDGNTAVYGQLQ